MRAERTVSDPVAITAVGPSTDTLELSQRTIRRITWRLVPFLVLLYLIAFIDRVNVGYAKLQMSEELNFSDAVYGFGAGIFFVGYSCSKFRGRCWWSVGARGSGFRGS